MKFAASLCSAFMIAGAAAAQCTTLHDQINIINDAGNGPFPAFDDASRISLDSTLFGYGCQGTNSTGLINNSMADQFTVPAGETWTINEVTLLTYSTAAVAPFVTGVVVDFGAAGGGPVVPTTTRVFTQGFAVSTTNPGGGVYRMTNTGGDSLRRVNRVVATINPPVVLTEGDYYMSWNYSATGVSSGPWQPTVQEAGNTATTPAGMAQQSIGGAAFAPVALSGGVRPAMPFILCGESGGGCYADCDGSGGLDFFDFLCFQNEFAAKTAYADCDGSGGHDFFDFLCFQNEFANGCP